jgi:hypothetical protein
MRKQNQKIPWEQEELQEAWSRKKSNFKRRISHLEPTKENIGNFL